LINFRKSGKSGEWKSGRMEEWSGGKTENRNVEVLAKIPLWWERNGKIKS